jgi:CRISPR-associated protein Cas5d
LWRARGGFIGSKIKRNQYRETERGGGRKSTGKKTQAGEEGRRVCSESLEEKPRPRRSIPLRRVCLSSISPLTAPTFSAAKGIFEAILRWKSVNVRPTRCEICAPVQFHRYAFNYGGPLRKSGQMKDGTSLQIFAQALINVCYRLHAEVDWNRGPNGEPAESPDGQCAPHAYLDAFHRRLERGRWFYTPCLGWKEFVPDYVGPFRDGTAPCVTENHVNPACLKRVLNQPQSGKQIR